MLLTGCGNSPPASAIPSVTATAWPTAQSSATAIGQPIMSTPSLSSTPSPILPVLTSRPTLTADERVNFVRQMLETNAGCELPCWWGITPGATAWQAVPEIFGAYGIVGELSGETRSYYFNPAFTQQAVHYYLGLNFTQQQEVVDFIQVYSSARDYSSTSQFAQDWRRYAPDQALARYGEPVQVYLHIVPWTPAYTLRLAYDHHGFDIVYGGTPTYITKDKIRVCIDFTEMNFIYLGLQSPQAEKVAPEEVAQPLAEVTSMDLETFYMLLQDPNSEICFETPANLWP